VIRFQVAYLMIATMARSEKQRYPRCPPIFLRQLIALNHDLWSPLLLKCQYLMYAQPNPQTTS
jgi:hypothetical protein